MLRRLRSHSHAVPVVLFLLVLLVFFLSAFGVPNPSEFLLEHAPTVLVLLAFAFFAHLLRLSTLAYVFLAVYFFLHIVGARYSWLVPYDNWSEALLGVRLADLFGFQRNMYDRFVHFFFGVLWLLPIHHVLRHRTRLPASWRLAFAFAIVLTLALGYEVFEWLVVVVFRGSAVSQTYVGLQGDIWDTQKDMGLALLGALVGLIPAARFDRPAGNGKRKAQRDMQN